MNTWDKRRVETITTSGSTGTLIIPITPDILSFRVVLWHGNTGEWAVEKTFYPTDYPGDEFATKRFAIAFIAGWGFSARWSSKSEVRIRAYTTSADSNGPFNYKLFVNKGV